MQRATIFTSGTSHLIMGTHPGIKAIANYIGAKLYPKILDGATHVCNHNRTPFIQLFI